MLLTAADLGILPLELASAEADYELDDGRLVLISFPFTAAHATASTNIMFQLWIQGEQARHGKARGRVGIVLSRNPDTVAAPDAAFIANKSLPIQRSPEGYLETIPELVVEVVDREDSLSHLQRKIEHYFKGGVVTVWIVDWSARTVTAHEASSEPVVYRDSDTLHLPDLIPGFSMHVADVFQE